jgi:hypothetical protein
MTSKLYDKSPCHVKPLLRKIIFYGKAQQNARLSLKIAGL